jgi:hypothetical protein
MTKTAEPTKARAIDHDQARAILAFAVQHGRTWKAALHDGRADETLRAELRQIEQAGVRLARLDIRKLAEETLTAAFRAIIIEPFGARTIDASPNDPVTRYEIDTAARVYRFALYAAGYGTPNSERRFPGDGVINGRFLEPERAAAHLGVSSTPYAADAVALPELNAYSGKMNFRISLDYIDTGFKRVAQAIRRFIDKTDSRLAEKIASDEVSS